MTDLIFIATAMAFFAVSVAYVGFCEKLRGESRD